MNFDVSVIARGQEEQDGEKSSRGFGKKWRVGVDKGKTGGTQVDTGEVISGNIIGKKFELLFTARLIAHLAVKVKLYRFCKALFGPRL